VNNAATSGEMSAFVDKDAGAVRATFELNLLSPVELAHVLLPGMVGRGAGAVVSVSSVSAWAPTPKSATYVATKRALAALDEVLRLELEGTGVHVVSVFPGPVRTPMLEKTLQDPLGANLRRLPTGNVEEMARRIRIAIEQRRDVVVYPDAFRPLRWLQPALGPLARLGGPLLARLGGRSRDE
jgi:short-subunit dehydrogenase